MYVESRQNATARAEMLAAGCCLRHMDEPSAEPRPGIACCPALACPSAGRGPGVGLRPPRRPNSIPWDKLEGCAADAHALVGWEEGARVKFKDGRGMSPRFWCVDGRSCAGLPSTHLQVTHSTRTSPVVLWPRTKALLLQQVPQCDAPKPPPPHLHPSMFPCLPPPALGAGSRATLAEPGRRGAPEASSSVMSTVGSAGDDADTSACLVGQMRECFDEASGGVPPPSLLPRRCPASACSARSSS